MDILVSSNLERLLYHLSGEDDKKVASFMASLSSEGAYTVDEEIKASLEKYFWGGYCNDADTQKTIGDLYKNENYLADTHTAVAVNVYEQYVSETGDNTPVVIASTASPYKFAKAVLSAVTDGELPSDEFAMVDELSAKTGTEIPAPLAGLKNAQERFSFECAVDEMAQTVLSGLGIN